MRNMNPDIRIRADDIKAKTIARYRLNFNIDTIQDLIQQVELLECEAISRFTGNINSQSFLDYFKKMVEGGALTFVLSNGDINIPSSTRFEYNRILSVRRQLTEELGHVPSVKQVAAIAGVGKRAVLNALAAEPLLGPAVRLDKPVDSENETTLINIIKSNTEDITQPLDTQTTNNIIQETLKTFPTDIRLIAKFIMEGLSVKEMSERTGLDPNYFYRLRKRAVRHLSRNKELRSLVNKKAHTA